MNDGVPRLGLDNAAPVPRAFGITFDTELAAVPSRVLNTPAVKYKNSEARLNYQSSWNLQGVKFAQAPPKQINSWTILLITEHGRNPIFKANDKTCTDLLNLFANTMRKYGINIAAPQDALTCQLVPRVANDRLRSNSMAQIVKTIEQHYELLIVLLANEDSFIYGGIKRHFDVDKGIHTICAQTNKITDNSKGGQEQYLFVLYFSYASLSRLMHCRANLALKLNAKFGGVNHLLQAPALRLLTLASTMLVGIDVCVCLENRRVVELTCASVYSTHPSPDSQSGTPSIAAVVASYEGNFAQYSASLGLQASKQETMFSGVPCLLQWLMTPNICFQSSKR